MASDQQQHAPGGHYSGRKPYQRLQVKILTVIARQQQDPRYQDLYTEFGQRQERQRSTA